MMQDMAKHQSFTRINKQFISKLKGKYDKVTLCSYITEKMKDSNINTGYLYYTKRTPFYDIASKNKEFTISKTHTEQVSVCKSILYSKINNTPGLILSTNNHNYIPPLNGKIILLSFFNKYTPDNGLDNFQEYYKVTTPYRFPILMEYMLDKANKGQSVHIKIANEILTTEVDLNDVEYLPK